MATTPTAGTGAGPAERGPGEAPAAGSGPAAVQPGPGDAAAPVEGFAARLGRLVADLVREPYRSGLAPIVRKELADNLLGSRFMILAGLVVLTALAGLYVAAQTIRNNVGTGVFDQFVFLKLFTTGDPQRQLPSLVSFLAFFTPLVGLALGFDAINGEESRRTLSRLLAQPIHRDAVINGKFVAGLLTIALMLAVLALLISGLGLRMIGVPPSGEEVGRLLVFFLVTLLYVAFWLSLSILFSVRFRQASTSALAGIAVWLFFALFGTLVADLLADVLVPLGDVVTVERQLRHETVTLWLKRLSPPFLYSEAVAALLDPEMRHLGLVLITEYIGAVPGSLPLSQSLLLIWPHVTLLAGATLAIFCISYVLFMRREVRA